MTRFHRDEGGQAIFLIALVMLALLFAVGLAIDSGQLYDGRRTAQEAADAAAFAGAIVLYQGGTEGQARAAAIADATLNGFTHGSNSTTVTINIPPLAGAYIGQTGYVEVEITKDVRTSLVPAQAALTTVRARGVASTTTYSGQYAVMATDQTCTQGDASVSSNGSMIVHGGSIQVNSCSSAAARNSGTVTLDTGYQTKVVGNVTGNWPNLVTGTPVEPDPFAGAPKPSVTGLSDLGTPQCAPTINQPGLYTGSASGNCVFIWAPGTYVFKGGGINLSGSSSGACTGTTCSTPTAAGGVFFFMTSSAYPSTTGGTCDSQPFKIAGGVNTTLSAPTSGTYNGLLVWQDSVCTSSISIGGGGSITTSGSIYAPNATVNGNGNGSAVTVSQIIAKKVDSQNAAITFNYLSSQTYHPPIPALVE